MKLYKSISNDEYNKISKLAYGIFGQESSFGSYGKVQGQLGRVTDVAQLTLNNVLGTKYNPSLGVTQIRFNNIRSEIRNKFNINSQSDLLNINKSAIATMTHLLDIYENEIPFNLKEKYNELIPLAYSNSSSFINYKKTNNNELLNNEYVKNVNKNSDKVKIYLGLSDSSNKKSNESISNKKTSSDALRDIASKIDKMADGINTNPQSSLKVSILFGTEPYIAKAFLKTLSATLKTSATFMDGFNKAIAKFKNSSLLKGKTGASIQY